MKSNLAWLFSSDIYQLPLLLLHSAYRWPVNGLNDSPAKYRICANRSADLDRTFISNGVFPRTEQCPWTSKSGSFQVKLVPHTEPRQHELTQYTRASRAIVIIAARGDVHRLPPALAP